MALTAQAPPPPGWARWPQHHGGGNDYVMMNPGMLPYDSRPVTSAPLQRPVMAPQYFTSGSYSPAPMTSMAAPPFQPPAQMQFGDYPTYSSSPTAVVSSPFKHTQPFPERAHPRVMSNEPERVREMSYTRSGHPRFMDGSRSPSIKSESQGSSTAKSVSSSTSVVSRTITSNVSVNGANHFEFNTEIDELMKAIQSKDDTDTIVKTAEAELIAQDVAIKREQGILTEAPSDGGTQPVKGPAPTQPTRRAKYNHKRYRCEIEGCGKQFHQKTHLDIHRRAHTGEKPYVCKMPGCDQTFSQLGNLKTHERRHTGEKPYACDQCGKRFAQRGNVRAHLKTHDQKKHFYCKLDKCTKQFTQLGNLKSHQNKFHKETLKNLTTKFMTMKDYDNVSDADRELWKYFATLYKNSNKGIKGRGKDRKVGTMTQPSPSPAATVPSYPPVHQQPPRQHAMPHGLPQVQQPLGPAPHHGHGLSHPAAYGMSRPNMPHGNYDMFKVEHDENAVGRGTHMYEERDLAFGDRMY